MARRIPTPAWTVGYQRGWLRGDVLAGVTITAYLIPQVMAYAEVAGLPAVVGLWASVGALVAYAALGSSTQLSVGPGVDHRADDGGRPRRWPPPPGRVRYADLASALCLVVAALCLLGWLGGLAFLAELLSRPVLVGLHVRDRGDHDRLPARQADRHRRGSGRRPGRSSPTWPSISVRCMRRRSRSVW